MKTIEELKRLNNAILNNEIGKAERNWSEADVAVVDRQPRTNPNGFYPDPFFVISKNYSLEISWMLEQLRGNRKLNLRLQMTQLLSFFN